MSASPPARAVVDEVSVQELREVLELPEKVEGLREPTGQERSEEVVGPVPPSVPVSGDLPSTPTEK